MVRYTHVIDQQVADQARVTDDKVKRVTPVVGWDGDMLSEVKAVQ